MKRYLLILTAVMLTCMTALGVFNYRVDPFLLFHHRGGDAATLGRIDQFFNMRVYKPYHVREKRPQDLIIGTSRSGSIWPEHPNWAGERSYNFAIPGLTLYEMSKSIEHAQAVQPLSHLLVGLDYQAFVRSSPQFRKGFEASRLLERPGDVYSPRFIGRWLLDMHAFLFSFDTLGYSLRALHPVADIPRSYYPDGVWQNDGGNLVGLGGYIYVARSAVTSIRAGELDVEAALPYYRDILEFCYGNDIDTTLFLTPTHVFFVDLWFRVAAEDLWRDTHRRIAALNEEIAARYGKEPFPLWGFGDSAAVTAEPIYRARDIDKAWFMDGVHASERLATRMMAAMQGDQDFGILLNSRNIDNYLDRVDALRAQFVTDNREQIEELHRSIGDVPGAMAQAPSTTRRPAKTSERKDD